MADVKLECQMCSLSVRCAARVSDVQPAWQTTTSMTESQHNVRLAAIVAKTATVADVQPA
jgi:hypothetical protein